ncbi:MAG: hypothetical protein KME49_01215 [Brasilonema octagenarum HA4186-MV1]|uniref:Uncharacterized protein n=1 Tax=Brasilonema octagenarum UFV-OR1 TaxID=417115 RepID=A0ABX1M6S8_9CYAN|nr:hypothetical protein [Brasilonema octagenarum]MBW4624153.1 hypothetical protein [Brasilonema octagenarum HA4186-MV1]NMF62816.1 hypothetical protein [Brasilonema octagenarum UFV-OR1]
MKSKVKTVAVTLSSIATVVNTSQSASAQLKVGNYGVQPGLEQNYLQYQISGRDLTQMRGIPGCSVGFGAACNKAGAVFQKLVESNGGPTHEQLLMQAAGGEQNYQNFAKFYANDPNLTQIPYASFWQNDNPSIVDGYRYLLGQTVNQSSQEGLGEVTKNFYWAPEGSGNSLDPRNGLLDFKYSYGRRLLEEVAKIPDAQQQIQALGLAPELTKFYSEKLSSSMRVLKSGNEESLKQTILKDLSMPYSPDGAELGRPNLGIPPISSLSEDTLAGDVVSWDTPVALDPDAMNLEVPPSLAEVALFPQEGASSFPTEWLALLPLLALLLLAFGGGGDSSSGQNNGSNLVSSAPPVGSSGGGSLPSGGGGGSGGNNQIIEVPPNHGVTPPGLEVKKVPEPTTITPLVLLIIVLYVLNHKQWRIQTRTPIQ